MQKYGGSSLNSPARIKKVAEKIARAAELSHRIIVVVSAMGRTTDDLIALAHQVSPEPQRRELDMLLTAGERISMALLSMALNDLGYPAISFTGSQSGIVTTMSHTRALIEEIRPQRISEALEREKIAIVAGFQGVSREKEVTTLGRGGSDTTAVALAGIFGAERCEIYSDFPGLFSADPRIVPHAVLIPRIDHDEMLELAALGARVLHYRAAEMARRYRVPLRLLSSFIAGPGTMVEEGGPMESLYFRSITYQENCSLFRIRCRGEVTQRLTEEMSSADVKIVLYQQERDREGVHVICAVEESARGRFIEALGNLGADVEWQEEKRAAAVSVVGGGFASRPHGVAQVTRCLAEYSIPVLALSSSSLAITCLIPRRHWRRAVELLHDSLLRTAGEGKPGLS